MHPDIPTLSDVQAEARRLDLRGVTLVAVSSIAVPATIRAMAQCLRQVAFSSAILFTDRAPVSVLPDGMTWRKIDPISSRADYSRFILNELPGHIETSHVLCVQWDGFVLQASNWDPQFLEFDYIGAPWPHYPDSHCVGNGGFSLRSRRLLVACRGLPAPPDLAEDIAICRLFRADLESCGIRFAPLDVARRFAFERYDATGGEFGFHGIFNLVRLLRAQEVTQLIAELEPEVMSRSEHRELLTWSLRHGRARAAMLILKRMLRRTLTSRPTAPRQ